MIVLYLERFVTRPVDYRRWKVEWETPHGIWVPPARFFRSLARFAELPLEFLTGLAFSDVIILASETHRLRRSPLTRQPQGLPLPVDSAWQVARHGEVLRAGIHDALHSQQSIEDGHVLNSISRDDKVERSARRSPTALGHTTFNQVPVASCY